ncbi:hypothetical protein ACGFNU_25120 [Spirillospora sp. NPDC048911]|uniref:hypothetical protein n=1 Tax=Spirillospora sp. NPDC048911 TaxID=3364527 RepID=UPI003721217A
MTVRLFTCASVPAALAMAAAIDAGMLGSARRVLLVSDETAIPELAPSIRDDPGFASAARRFDDIVSWNETIAPAHPGGWTPRSEDRPMFERMLRREWDLGDEPVELVLGSATSAPGRALATIFRSGPVTVCTGSPEVYAPTPAALPTGMGSRIERLLHLDLVPGLAPHLLAEYGTPAEAVPPDAYRTLLTEAAAELDRPLIGTVLIIGAADRADTLDVTTLRGVAASGHTTVVYAPSPRAPTWSSLAARMSGEAETLGVRLLTATPRAPAEVLCATLAPNLLVGSDVSALLSAWRHLDTPAAHVETFPSHAKDEHQIPAVIATHLFPQLSPEGVRSAQARTSGLAQGELGDLVTAVGYCLRPGSRPDLRASAVAYLERHVGSPYFRRERLAELGLPGGAPPPAEEPAAAPPELVMRRRGRITTRLLRSR